MQGDKKNSNAIKTQHTTPIPIPTPNWTGVGNRVPVFKRMEGVINGPGGT